MAGHLPDVRETISAAIKSKRIGTPVFARIVAHAATDPEETGPLLGSALEATCSWLSDEPSRVTALGSLSAGGVSVLAEFPRGQTALVSTGTRGASPPRLEAVLIGTGGVASWTPADGHDIQAKRSVDRPSKASQRLLDAVRQSIESGRPVRSEDGHLTIDEPSDDDVLDFPARRGVTDRRLQPASPPYGVLLVSGAQSHQENYAEALAADRRCRLVGVTDESNVSRRRRALNEELARKLRIPLLSDMDQALGRNDVHIVSVVADPERRARVSLRCAKARKHLYLDKPMAASAREAVAVVDAIREAGVVGHMFSQVRSSVAERLRRVVESGALGELRAVHLDLTFAKGPGGAVKIDKPRRESLAPDRFETVDSKRELFNVGVYPLVLLEWLLGRPVRRVRAVTGNYFFAEHQRNDMEDFAAVLLELEGGLTASLAVGRTGWRSHPMGGLNRTCVIGDKNATTVDAYRPRWEVWADEMPWLPPRTDPQDPMGFWKSTFDRIEAGPKKAWLAPTHEGPSDAAYFLDCIEHGRPSDVSAEVGAAAVRTLMAAYRSAATGRFVVFQ
jgi:predicted dehydrogenase